VSGWVRIKYGNQESQGWNRKKIKSLSLFWDITRHRFVVGYRRFGIKHRPPSSMVEQFERKFALEFFYYITCGSFNSK
jgi:hypothetical protein